MAEAPVQTDSMDPRAPKNLKQVSLRRDIEVQYWSHRLNASRAALEEAVEHVGSSVNAVTDYLAQKKSGDAR